MWNIRVYEFSASIEDHFQNSRFFAFKCTAKFNLTRLMVPKMAESAYKVY